MSKLEENLSECQGYHYSQSSNVSTLLRSIIYTIIGIIWVVAYNDTKFLIPNIWLYIALGLSFGYILFDVTHYFIDSYCYRQQYFRLEELKIDKTISEDEIIDKHEEYMTKVSKRSFGMIVFKFILMFLTSIVFIIGCILHFKP